MNLRRAMPFGPFIVALSGVVMCIWSWGTWPDVILDFGRELYVPWQISEGRVLYRDIVSYFNGPLSPHVHAILFKVFGVGLNRLVWFNLVVVAGLSTMLYWLLHRAFGATAAIAGGVSFFGLFAFAQYRLAGNYNYVTPYSYELTHGIALSLAAMIGLEKFRETQRPGWIVLAGLMLGLVALTKAEIFLAAAVALGAGVLLTKPSRGVMLAMLLGLIVPTLLAFVLLLIPLGPADALWGLAGSWKWLGDRELLSLPFFQEVAGTDDIARSLRSIAAWSGIYGLFFGIPAWLGRRLRSGRGVAVGSFIVLTVIGIVVWDRIDWENSIRAMPVVLGIVGIWLLRGHREQVLPIVLIVWSFAMLAKIPLNAHLYHYGFALAMPVTISGIAILVGWLPKQIDRAGGSGRLLRGVAGAALVVTLFAHVRIQAMHWADKTIEVGIGADRFYSDDRAIPVNQALSELARIRVPGSTLAVVPEGLLINYLARMPNPTGQLNFTPPALIMYGDEEMLRVFQANPPEFLILTGVVTIEYGARFFGEDYARELGQWMQQNYAVVRTIGPRPFRDPGFGLVLFRRIR